MSADLGRPANLNEADRLLQQSLPDAALPVVAAVVVAAAAVVVAAAAAVAVVVVVAAAVAAAVDCFDLPQSHFERLRQCKKGLE